MTRIEHWAENGMLTIILREDVQAVVGQEVAPGIVLHYAQKPGEPGDETELALDNRDVVSIEIEAARGRDVRALSFEQRNDAGEVTQSISSTATRRTS